MTMHERASRSLVAKCVFREYINPITLMFWFDQSNLTSYDYASPTNFQRIHLGEPDFIRQQIQQLSESSTSSPRAVKWGSWNACCFNERRNRSWNLHLLEHDELSWNTTESATVIRSSKFSTRLKASSLAVKSFLSPTLKVESGYGVHEDWSKNYCEHNHHNTCQR